MWDTLIHSGYGQGLIARHRDYFQEAISACEFAAAGPKKDEAELQLREPEVARITGNEVKMLLAIYRTIHALK